MGGVGLADGGDRIPRGCGCSAVVLEFDVPGVHARRSGTRQGGGDVDRGVRGPIRVSFPTLGILPETNSAFAVHELSAYDPITPRAPRPEFDAGNPRRQLCPSFGRSTKLACMACNACLFPKGPTGCLAPVFDRTIGDEDLLRIPGAARPRR